MANNNIQSVQFLRNADIYANRNAATSALTGLTSKKDGMIALARYRGANNTIYTLAGYYAVVGQESSVTIFDVEGTSGSIEALRQEINAKLGNGITSGNTATAQLTALSGNSSSTSGETSVAGAKKYTDGKLDALDANSVADENKVVSDVTQANGQITATAKNITEVKLGGYAEGTDADIVATDTLGQALGKLQAQINAMDKAASAVDGQVVTTVAEADGKVTETKANVKDLQLGGYTKDTTATGDIASTDTVNTALSKLENTIVSNSITNADGSITVTPGNGSTDVKVHIKEGEKVIKLDANGDGIYTDIDLVKITTGLPAEVKERYQLLASDDTQLGVNIDIPKDSHIVSITYITDSGDTHYQNLEYKYIDASGNTQTTYVDMSSLVLEAEFASGITVTNNVAHGVVDATSEKDESNNPFLTVGANGFNVSGIKDAIDTKINKLDATVTGGTTSGTATSNHIQVVVAEVDGKLTGVTVSEANIADKSALDELSGKTFTVATSSNGSITTSESNNASDNTTSIDLITDASKIKMSGFTSETGGFSAITEDSSITQAIKQIEIITIENEETVSAALNDLETRKAEKTDVNDKYNYLNDKIEEIASATTEGLDKEIAARKAVDGINGSAYTATATANYISNATSLNDADQKLDAKLFEVSRDYVSAATMNGSAVTKTNNSLTFSVSASASAATAATTNAIVIDTSDTGELTFSLGSLDCGTY